MKAKTGARFLSPDDHAEWGRLVASAPSGSIYATPEYLDALCEATGGRFRILAAHRGDELLGGVALYEESSRFGPSVSTRLLLQYNGVVLRTHGSAYPSQRTARGLEQTTALCRALDDAGYSRLSLKCRPPFTDARAFLQAGWSARPTYTYEVSLADLEAAWGRVEQNLRRLVKRGEREGLTVSDDDDFDSFFRMHLETHERKGAALYLPEPGFRRYFERLRARGLCRLYHARRTDGRSIATVLVLTGAHPVTHTVSAAADGEFLKMGASAFLRWKVFEDLSRRGFAANDLTDASLNPVTHFKAQLGGDLRTCVVLERPDPLPLRAYGQVTGLIRGLRQRLGAGS